MPSNNFFSKPIVSSPGKSAEEQSKTIAANTPYDIAYAFTQQSSKNTNKLLRMRLSVPSPNIGEPDYVFQAHLDPNHLINEQGKRVVELDTLTGVVIQDFGFKPERLELKGTTGSSYYREIGEMDLIFNSQSLNGTPTRVTLKIEDRTYQCVWLGWMFGRQQSAAGGNLIEYTMNFTVLQRGESFDVSNNLYDAAAQNKRPDSSLPSASGTTVQKNVDAHGKSPRDYCKSTPEIPKQKIPDALSYIKSYWNTKLNGGLAYQGDNFKLKKGQVLTVPNNWADIIGSTKNPSKPPPKSNSPVQIA